MIKCIECKYLYGIERSVNGKYAQNEETLPFDIVSDGAAINMCQHSNCFEHEQHNDPIIGIVKTRHRINGQAQFNKNNDCKYFEEKNIFQNITNFLREFF